ncbi:MAG: TIGR02301 family protein [Alphaproteobacteria bacterium]|nr:TIGR02301 family protein [Alphaproteobacteria bacterium]
MMLTMRTLLVLACTTLMTAPVLAQKQQPQGAQPVEESPRFQTEPYDIVRQRNERLEERRNSNQDSRRAARPVRGYPDPAPQSGFEQARTPQTIPEVIEDRMSDVDVDRVLPFLAYTLGELHYLAFACEGTEVQTWRDQMIQLMALEAESNGRRRDELIENFNDGYRVQQRYRPVCGPQTDAERRALAFRGRDLSEMMRSAYFD